MYLSKVKLNKEESESYFVKQAFTYGGDDYWDWSVWIESADAKKLDNVQSVTYHLHNTFPNPVRIITDRKSNFKLEASGWGTFKIYIIVKLKDKSVIELKHNLILEYPDTPSRDAKRSVRK